MRFVERLPLNHRQASLARCGRARWVDARLDVAPGSTKVALDPSAEIGLLGVDSGIQTARIHDFMEVPFHQIDIGGLS